MECSNCHAQLNEGDAYCWNCGQENTDGRVTLISFLKEVLSSVFSLDAKAYRTIIQLFIPGELTIAYFQGKRKQYFTPLRIFLFMGVIHFFILSWVLPLDKLVINNDGEDLSFDGMVARNVVYRDLDTARVKLNGQFGSATKIDVVFDSLFAAINYEGQDSVNFSANYIGRDFKPKEKEINLAYADFENKDIGEIVAEQGLDHWMERKQFVQVFRLVNDTPALFRFIIGKLVWMALIMMPVVALLLKLMYVRRKRFYVEHLFFVFHYHAFAFLIFSLLIIWPNWHGQGALVALGITLLYLYIAMWRYYGQGWFKTFIKFFILNWTYLFLFTFFLTMMFVVSIFLF